MSGNRNRVDLEVGRPRAVWMKPRMARSLTEFAPFFTEYRSKAGNRTSHDVTQSRSVGDTFVQLLDLRQLRVEGGYLRRHIWIRLRDFLFDGGKAAGRSPLARYQHRDHDGGR
jgi:hypothetical protein